MISLRLLVTVALFLSLYSQSLAQSNKDLNFIFSHKQDLENPTRDVIKKKKRIIPYIFKPGYLFFKHTIYDQLGMSCYFKNQCNEFCGDLIEEFGLFKGYFVSFDRVVRCNRFAPIESYPSALTSDGKVIDELRFYQNH